MVQVKKAIGIDLGSSYTCVAVYINNWVEIVANEQGGRKTPSCVAFRDGEELVGDAAINQAAMNTSNTIYDMKRLIGRRFSEPSVQKNMETWPFTVTPGPREQPLITVSNNGEERRFTADEICAVLLKRIKAIADDFLKLGVKDCVIAVPGDFSRAQREATANAGRLAGMNVIRITNEANSAALAYARHRESAFASGPSKLLIFDLGGGSLSVSVVSVDHPLVEVKAVAGDSQLGGKNFDARMVSHFVKEFRAKQGKDITGSARAMFKLAVACERAKRALSVSSKTIVDVDALFEGIDFYSTITREDFEKLNMDLFEMCLRPVDRCLQDANVGKSDIDNVVLVGGSSRIPKVQELLRGFFDGKELCKSHVNPDEAVAFGAALLASKLIDDGDDWQLMDVVPRSIGLEIAGGEVAVVIPRNTSIPVTSSLDFWTFPNYGCCVLLSVFEGESSRAADNDVVAVYELCDLPPAPPRGLRILVTVDIHADSAVSIRAEADNTKINCIPRRLSTPLYPVMTAS